MPTRSTISHRPACRAFSTEICMKFKLAVIAFAIVGVVGVIGLVTYNYWPSSAGSVVLNSHAPATLVRSLLKAPPRDAPTAVAPPEARTPAPIWDRSNLSREFVRLAKSSKPAEKYAAWKLAEECKWAHIISPKEASPEVCGDLQPGQWDGGQVRADLIRVAALAGVHHAWWDLLTREAASATFHSFQDGPECQELEATAHRVALEVADPQALMVEQGRHMKSDPTKSVALWAAFRLSRAADRAEPYQPEKDGYLAELARERGADLPQAITNAKALIAAANRSQK